MVRWPIYAMHIYLFQCKINSSQCTNVVFQWNFSFSTQIQLISVQYCFQCENRICQCTKVFPVHKNSRCTNVASVHKSCLSVQKLPQCTNISCNENVICQCTEFSQWVLYRPVAFSCWRPYLLFYSRLILVNQENLETEMCMWTLQQRLHHMRLKRRNVL